MRHGELPVTELDLAATDDPDARLVLADMDTWLDAHPCSCEALCECDQIEGHPV